MDDRKISATLRKLNRMIAKEWRQIDGELKRCARSGDYQAEMYLRSVVNRRQQELIKEWQDWRLTQPPFRTKENGFYVQHPVTPENAYLLSPHYVAAGQTVRDT